jgi:gamma-glutamyltranspeptidase
MFAGCDNSDIDDECLPCQEYTLTVEKKGIGSGTVIADPEGIDCGEACSGAYNGETAITLTATPDEGSVFGGWSGACTGTSPTCTFTMDGEQSVTASFFDEDSQGVVSVSHPLAAEAGAKVLENGGNAIDAAAAIQFVLNVVEPQFSGIGGGGFMMIHHADTDETFIVESREKAPAAATPDMFLDNGEAIPWDELTSSGVAVGVPGTLMGVATALDQWGTISLSEALADAIKLAEDGFCINEFLARDIDMEETQYQPETAAVFRHADGTPLKRGELLVQSDLAKTFKLIAAGGTDVFYKGEIAEAIVQAQLRTRAGDAGTGRMAPSDLAAYDIKIRQPIVGDYRGYTVKSMSPPSSGGLTVVQMLKMLERFPLGDASQGYGFGALKTLHVMSEAMRLAYADRAVWMGDEDFVPVPKVGLLADEYIQKRSALIQEDVRMETPSHDDPWPYETDAERPTSRTASAPSSQREGMHTTHFSVVDKWGNMVSYTTTIESYWGTGIMVPGYGFILNNELTDFNGAPAYSADTGDPGANDVAAFKRPRSSMAPSMLFKDGKPVAAYGSPGGSTIINSVLQITLNLVDHGMSIQEAIDSPRISVHNAEGSWKRMEPGFDPDVVEGLIALGHPFSETPSDSVGSVQAVYADPETGEQFGGADSRREGTVIKLPRAAVTYTLTVDADGTGSGTVSSEPAGIACGAECLEIFDKDAVITLTAVPDENSEFAGWGGACSGTESCTVTMSQSHYVTATFNTTFPVPEYTLSITKSGEGSGTVSADVGGISCGDVCSANISEGSAITLTAVPDEGSEFVGWEGACSGTDPCVVTIDQAKAVTAVFKPLVTEGFSTADLAGTWHGYFRENNTQTGAIYWFYGTLNVDASGNVTGGTYTAPNGTTGAYSGGQLALDENGVMTGTVMAAEGVTISVQNGKMDQSKDFGTFASASDDGTLDLGILVKGGGAFATADLAGTWYGHFAEANPNTGEAYWFHGSLDLDAAGNVTGGNYTSAGGNTGTYTGGQLALDENGILSGTLTASEGVAITVQNGKMDPGKTFGTFTSTSDDGTLDVGTLIKSGGAFAASDLEGDWHGYFAETNTNTGEMYWFYGMLNVGASGNVSGDFTAADGTAGTYTGGQLALDENGVLTGSLTSSDGTTITVQNGKMDQGKTFGSLVSSSDDSTLDVGILIKCTAGSAVTDPVAPDFINGTIVMNAYDGETDDLLTAGLGAEGLAGAAPGFADPANPTAAELRRLAIYNNYRAIVDTTPGGGYGDLYGPAVGVEGSGKIAGKEYLAYADDGTGKQNVTLMVQIPSTFDPANACIVTAPSSGSRGIYGAIGSAGEWGLKKGCAVAYTDKGTGMGTHDLDTDTVNLMTGERADAAAAAKSSNFTAEVTDEFVENNPGRLAFKHAHSQQNPEADWGKNVLQSVKFAFYLLNLEENFGQTITPENTLVIGSSVSNGGSASVRAAEQDTEGLIDGVAVSEPNVSPTGTESLIIRQGNTEWTYPNHSRSLFDYYTFLNLYQPCANLASENSTAPFNTVSEELEANRCAELYELGLLESSELEYQASEAQQIINAYGILEEQNNIQPSHYNFYVVESIAVTYANSYGRFSVTDNLCGFSFAGADPETGAPAPLADTQLAAIFASGNGIPPTGGATLMNNNSQGGPMVNRNSVSASGLQDMNLDGALCLRSMATGTDAFGESLEPEGLGLYNRVQEGISEVRASGNLHSVPTVIVHGRSDAVLPPNHTSRAYFGLNKMVEGGASKLYYYEVTNAHHLDAFNAFPGFNSAYVPLHHYYIQALNMMYDHLKNGTPLPPSQLVRTIPRGVNEDGTVPALTQANLPPISADRDASDLITFTDGNIVNIPE